MKNQTILYIECKAETLDNPTGYFVLEHRSKSGRTVYFNNKALKQFNGYKENYYDIETGEEYWVSGAKKNMQDQLNGDTSNAFIQEEAVELYLKHTGKSTLPKSYTVVKLKTTDVERFNEIENSKLD